MTQSNVLWLFYYISHEITEFQEIDEEIIVYISRGNIKLSLSHSTILDAIFGKYRHTTWSLLDQSEAAIFTWNVINKLDPMYDVCVNQSVEVRRTGDAINQAE